MERKFYKGIILVLSTDDTPFYRYCKRIYESYMFRNPNIKVFFVYGAGTTFIKKSHDLVYNDLEETITPPWTTRKVIRAMEEIDNNYDYDFLIRTNLSTFWYFDGLIERLSALPTSECFAGILSNLPREHSARHLSGISMIMSRDIVKQIVKYSHLINIPHPQYVAEDKMISNFVVHTLGIDILVMESTREPAVLRLENIYEFDSEDLYRILAHPRHRSVFFFRVKNIVNRMTIDTQILKLLRDLYYPSRLKYNPDLLYRKHKLYGPSI